MWILITITIFFFTRWLSKKYRTPFLNPLLISMALIISLLVYFNVPFDIYYQENKPINMLLQPAVVALAYPLYEQLHQIRANWRIILLACSVGSIMAMLSTVVIAVLLRTDLSLIASMLGKSVTTAIAMEISSSLGGEPTIAAMLVLIAGVFGATLAYPIYRLLNITHPIAKGLTMGTISHALGTATCAENDPRDAAFSSLALIICGIITSILAPSIFAMALLFQSYIGS